MSLLCRGRLLQAARTASFSLASRSASASPTINDRLFGLTDEQIELRKSIRDFCEKELTPHAAKIDRDDNWPQMREFWKKLGDQGLLGITAPTEYGGTGLTYTAHALAIEELSRASGSMGVSYACHSQLAVNQIVLHANQAQKAKYLPKLCSGEHFGSLAMSEPGAGSDVVNMKLRADKKGDRYILNGSKLWITNGPVADTLFVYAKTDMKKHQHGITPFIVEKKFKGFGVARKLDKLGMRGSPTGELVFEDCEVPEENVVGELNKGVYVLMKGLDIERAVFSAAALGLMQAACDAAFDYAHQREAFGQKIGTFQLLQGKMADMYTKLNSTRAYIYSVVRAADQGHVSPKDCAAVILYAAENATQVCLDAIQIHGGNGYTNDYPVGRFMRDAKVYEIGAGTSEIRRLLIGRALNKEYSR